MVRLAPFVILAASSTALAASAPVQRESSSIDRQLRQARAEAAAAVAEQKRLEQSAAKARDDVSRLRAQQLAAVQAISATEAEITAVDAGARLIEAKLAAQKLRLAREQAPLSALLGGLALTARRPPVLLLADSGSVEDLVKLRLLLAAIAPAIRGQTASLSQELERSASLEQAARGARKELSRQRDELTRRRQSLAALEAQAAQLAKRRGSAAFGAGDIALSARDRLAIAEQGAESGRKSARLANELAALGPAPVGAGRRPPAQPPLAYRLPAQAAVTMGLGAVSPNGVRSRGITLATKRGDPILAPASGRILFAGPFRDYDSVMIIDHGDGWKSVLVNAGSQMRRGKTVRMGQRIGIALGPVELELQRNGQPVSPALIAGSSAVLSNGPEGG